MSSKDELVHEPIKHEEMALGQPSLSARAPIAATEVHRSGVKGPLMCGPSSVRLIV